MTLTKIQLEESEIIDIIENLYHGDINAINTASQTQLATAQA